MNSNSVELTLFAVLDPAAGTEPSRLPLIFIYTREQQECFDIAENRVKLITSLPSHPQPRHCQAPSPQGKAPPRRCCFIMAKAQTVVR